MSILSVPDKSHRHRLPVWYTGSVEDRSRSEELTTGRLALCLDRCTLTIDLEEMARHPLPGGIAAASASAAMGAALVAKSVRIALRRCALDAPGQAELKDLAGLADRHASGLLGLADADTEAYRSVLDTRALAADDPVRQRAWLAAVEVPLRLAELSLPLEEPIRALFGICPPVVHAELQVGARLLHTASEAGRLAAAENLRNCVDSHETGLLRLRLAALKETFVD